MAILLLRVGANIVLILKIRRSNIPCVVTVAMHSGVSRIFCGEVLFTNCGRVLNIGVG